MRSTGRTLTLLLAILTLAVGIPQAQGGEVGHFGPGAYNIRDFVVPDPGVYYVQYNVWYTSETLKDVNGKRIDSITINPGPGQGLVLDLDINVDVFTIAPAFIWSTPWKILGARYAAYVSPTIGNPTISTALSIATGAGRSAEDSQTGIGDVFAQPLWLGWSMPHWDLSFGYGVYLPIGNYDVTTYDLPIVGPVTVPDADNIGLGFWTHQFQAASAWYPWKEKGTAVTVAVTGEAHGKKRDVPITPGSDLTLNWGVSQYLPLRKDASLLLEVGPAGYNQWQVSEDSGASANDNLDQVHAAGVQLGVVYVPWRASLNSRYSHEFGAKDRFEGDMLTLTFAVGL